MGACLSAGVVGCAVALALSATLVACGEVLVEGAAPRPAPYAGDPEGPPTLGVLPEMPQQESQAAARQHQALLVAREVLDSRVPAAPSDRSYDALQRWSQGPLAAWIRHRRQEVERARSQFTLGGEPGLRDGIVQHAVMGLLHEDTAAQLVALPEPAELDDEPEVARMYREVVAYQAEPFASSALLEYRTCAQSAYEGPTDLRHWGDFCAGRFERLKARTLALRQAAVSAAGD